MYKSLTLLAFLAFAGCSIVGTPAAKHAAELIAYYCDTESPGARALYRQMINDELAEYGHEVAIVCYTEPPR